MPKAEMTDLAQIVVTAFSLVQPTTEREGRNSSCPMVVTRPHHVEQHIHEVSVTVISTKSRSSNFGAASVEPRLEVCDACAASAGMMKLDGFSHRR